jgi:NAD-dependent histone deacetylase SIR2
MDVDDCFSNSELSSLQPSSPPRSFSSDSTLSSLPPSPELQPRFIAFTPPPSQDAGEDMPPARKRRKVETRERTTRHLDLTSDTAQSQYDRDEAKDVLYEALHERKKIVVIAGAGISVSAGIPDFRSSHGLFRSLRDEHKLKSSGKELFDASVYKDDSSTASFHEMVRKMSRMSEKAKPTAFHHLVARLAAEGRLLRLYTQNIDGIETSLPPLATEVPLKHKAPWPRTVQLHGGLEKMMCQKCRHISNFEPDLFDGPTPPQCPECVSLDSLRTIEAGKRSHGIGRLRPRIVLYNEHNPDDEAIGAVTTSDLRQRPDAVIVVGTSLKIGAVKRIVREMCGIVRDRKIGTAIWINRDPVPPRKEFEDAFDLIVKGDADEVAKIAGLKEWDDLTKQVVEEYTDEDLAQVLSSQGEVKVIVPPSPERKAKIDFFHTNEASMATPPRSDAGERKPKIKSDSASKPSPLKMMIAVEIPPKKLFNPASIGRSLSAVLGKENKNKTAKKPKSKTTNTTTNKKSVHHPSSIRTQPLFPIGKVTKAVDRTILTNAAESKPSKPLSAKPLSPKNNYNVLPPPLYSSTEASPAPSTPPARDSNWGQTDTISPAGSVPRDMVKLLN